MTGHRILPSTASVADTGEGAKLVAPSATRNRDDIAALLSAVAPPQGHALELASGTGQHIIAFAAAMPNLIWQPSDIDPSRRASIDAYVADAGLNNLLAARAVDATKPDWGTDLPDQSLIVLINLLHLISGPEAQILITQTAVALAPGGRLVIYGPFMRGGDLTSDGDASFHASLTAADPEIGYKDDFDTLDMMQQTGLTIVDVVEMPANNLALIAEKPPI